MDDTTKTIIKTAEDAAVASVKSSVDAEVNTSTGTDISAENIGLIMKADAEIDRLNAEIKSTSSFWVGIRDKAEVITLKAALAAITAGGAELATQAITLLTKKLNK